MRTMNLPTLKRFSHSRRAILATLLIWAAAALLGACAPVEPSPTPTPTLAAVQATLAPGELLRISGDGPFVSEPFQLAAETTVRVFWKQSSEEAFTLTIFNLDETLEGTRYGRVTYEHSIGPSSWFSEYTYIPGEYAVEIESADGPWEVWIEVVETD